MILTAGADRCTGTSIVEGPGEDEVLELIRRWYEEDEPALSGIEQLVAYGRRETRALSDRLLGVRSSDGRLVAIAKLRSGRATAQVEDVYTVPEARGRGFARALITRAVALARETGHELIFIVADDENWPKRLYERLGFRAARLSLAVPSRLSREASGRRRAWRSRSCLHVQIVAPHAYPPRTPNSATSWPQRVYRAGDLANQGGRDEAHARIADVGSVGVGSPGRRGGSGRGVVAGGDDRESLARDRFERRAPRRGQSERQGHDVLLPVGPYDHVWRRQRRALGRARNQGGGGQHDGQRD